MKRENNERTNSVLHAVRSIARQPVIRRIGVMCIVDPVAQLGESPPASLSPTDLYVLLKEYEFGIGGRTPVKDFNERERGAQGCFLSSQGFMGHDAQSPSPWIYKRDGHNITHL
jgi:hypothetical protein